MKNQKNSTALRLSGSTASKGFTLVELLVVIGIIAILFAVVLVAINPAKRFAEANNARRLSDVNSILNGVLNYTVDQKGAVPLGLTVTTTSGSENYIAVAPRLIGTGAALAAATSCSGIKTCTGNGFGSCTATSDCDNTCTETSATSGIFTCKLTGVTCTGSGGTLCVDTVGGDNICDDGITNTPNGRATQCGDPSGFATCASSKCSAGPLVGRYCNITDDCNEDAATPICSATEVISAFAKYDLGSSTEGVIPAYLASVPADPANSTSAPKYYAIENVKGAGRIHVIACNPDDPEGDGLTNNKIEVIR